MNWLQPSRAGELLAGVRRDVQTISLPADVAALFASIPLPPEVVPPADGPPSTELQWYAEVGGRIILVRIEERSVASAAAHVCIETHFVGDRTSAADWQVLEDLRGLPESIRLFEPDFVESRHPKSNDVVCKRNHGIASPTYRAGSYSEAVALIAFIRRHGGPADRYEILPAEVGR